MDQRLIAVGDIHGCADELQTLLNQIRPVASDTFVFLGDYIDRGPASRKVIDVIIELGLKCTVIPLKGNHESMFIDFLLRPESLGAGLFVLNGGTSTLLNYAMEDGSIELPESHENFFRNLKLTYETADYFFVHAGVPEIPLAKLNSTEHEIQMLWSRQPFLSSEYKWEKIIVHGHTPIEQYELRSNRINLDTGCVYGGMLTALDLHAKKFFQVERNSKVNETPLYPSSFETARISMRYSGRLNVKAKCGDSAYQDYETLNYNQFGMLMRETQAMVLKGLNVGDVIQGLIGPDPEKAIEFSGAVVRCETRGSFAVYGIRIDKIGSDSGTATVVGWIERPKQ